MKTNSSRWLLVALYMTFVGLMLLCGWLVPMHLRAVDASVLRRAGEGSTSLVDCGLALARAGNADAARLILQAAQEENMPQTEDLAAALAAHSQTERLFPGGPVPTPSTPLTAQVIQLENREKVLAYLQSTGSPAVRELLHTRDLTNTVLFPPSPSASGQAFDAAISVCGLLLTANQVTPVLRDAVVERAALARTHSDAQPLEEILMDLMSLGQRLNGGQLAAFVGPIKDPSTLALLAGQARNAGAQWPALFAAVVLSKEPEQVAAYLNDFSQTGLHDLTASLRDGEGGVDELLRRHQRLESSPLRQQWTASGPLVLLARAGSDFTLRVPWLALTAKWLLYLLSGFLLATAGQWARPVAAGIKEPKRGGGFHRLREFLFALGFLLVVLLLSEPFLAQESQKAEFAFRLRLPSLGAAAASTTPLLKTKLMDTRSLLTLLLFFVLQGLIYCACLIKLAEIRRQKLPARFKLKLLENEEHLFDGGLYLGFAGTIVCLILVSLGIIQQSLMAAYSSTSFGIIFVSIFKIFNLRPARRQLLMETQVQAVEPERVASPAMPLKAVL